MNTKDIDNKIPIYQLDSKEKVLKYYIVKHYKII